MFEDIINRLITALQSHSQVCEVTHYVFSYQTLSTSSTEPSGITGKYEALKLGKILTSRTHTSSWELPFNTETVRCSNIHKQDVYHIKRQEATKVKKKVHAKALQNAYTRLTHTYHFSTKMSTVCLHYSSDDKMYVVHQLNETVTVWT